MSGSVDEIELVVLSVARRIRHPHGVELDGDPALPLEVQSIEHLGLHLALLQHAGGLDEPVGEGRLAVIDVCDDAEVADVLELQRGVSGLCGMRRKGRRNITVKTSFPGAHKRKRAAFAALFSRTSCVYA